MTLSISRRHLLALGAAPLAGLGLPALAQSYPERAIRVVVPYTPGAGTDVVARLVMRKLSDRLGQPVVVENKPGAGSTIGAADIAMAQPDGYNLLWGDTSTFAVNPHVYPNVRYDPRKSFEAVGPTIAATFVLVVSPRLNIKTVQELVAYAKANPGKLNYGSAGSGTPHHIAMESLKNRYNLRITHIPYKGEAPAVQDLLGGSIDLMFAGAINAATHADAGKLLILGASGSNRSPRLPKVPTLAEQGLKDFSYAVWHGVAAPAGTPAPIVQKLSTELQAVMNDPEVRDWLAKNSSAEATPGSAANLKATIAKDFEIYRSVVKEAGLKPGA